MAVHVGIIDQDPIRLVTPLLDNRTISNHIVFIGVKSQIAMYQRLEHVLAKRNITAEFFEIPNVANTSRIKRAVGILADDLSSRGEEVKLNASCGLRHQLLSVYEIFVHSIGQSSSLNQIPIGYVGYIRMVKRIHNLKTALR